MTLAEIKNILESTGLPVVYLAFKETEVPPMPFITYFETGSDNFSADGFAYHKIKQIQVNLFTDKKDINAESLVENALDGACIFWNKEIDDDTDEHCLNVSYDLEV